MPGLKDIAPTFKTITVKGTKIGVDGIGADGIAYLFVRFPVLREMIGGKDVNLSVDDLVQLGPEAIGAIIACGTGDVNDPEAERVARKLPAEAQADLLEAIIGETMPSGLGPFMERVTRWLNLAADAKSTSIPDGTQQ